MRPPPWPERSPMQSTVPAGAPAILLYCRPGFEGECAREISGFAAELGIWGHVRAKPDGGYLSFHPHEEAGALLLRSKLRFGDLVFPRQVVHRAFRIDSLPVTDRATPVADAAAVLGENFSDVWIETADTNEAKELSSFCRRFAGPLNNALRDRELLADDPRLPRLHVLFLGSGAAWIGLTNAGNSAPWPMGIPSLKMPRGAPSRSTLKLAEAFLVFLTAEAQAEWLREGLTAVDLGAAPGGWTWQLVHRGLHVTAVDNGALDPALLADDRVEHLRADGLTWRPRRPADWLVCDMVEKPSRIARLVGDWVAEGHCRRAVFNLKLPMKRRYDEVLDCRQAIADRLDANGIKYRLRMRQLYHDREEVTGYLETR